MNDHLIRVAEIQSPRNVRLPKLKEAKILIT